nr:zinc finger protein 182-like [Procambarus clarkii]
MKRHEANKPHERQDCDKKFVTKSGLDIHRRKHTGERPYKCDNCSKAFTTRSVLIMHMRGHTGEKPYECNTCGARFTQSATRADHMRRHTGEKQYQFTTCPEKFVTRINYRGHILLSQRKSKIECKICKKQFTSNLKLKNHMVKHSNERPFECGECGRKFKSKISVASHLKSVHSNEKPYKCDICMKRFAVRSSLILHTMTHTNIGRVQCEQCGRMLNSKRHVLRHQTSQTGCKRNYVFKPFFCKLCGTQFNNDSTARKHRRIMDCTKTHVRFLCDFCREDCKTYEGLLTHLLDHAEPGRKGYDSLLHRMTHSKKRINPAWVVKVYNSDTVSTSRDSSGAYINIDQRQVTSVPTDHTPAVHNNTVVHHQRDNVVYHKTAMDHRKTVIDHHETVVDHREIAVDYHKTAIDYRKTAVDHHETDVDHHRTAVDHHKPAADHHKTAVNVLSQDSCFTGETNFDKINTNEKLNKYEGRKYLGNTEAYYNLDSNHVNGVWGTCRDLGNNYILTRELQVRDKCDIEVIKHACVMQRSYPMIKEAEEVSVKEENETVDKWEEEPEMQKTSDRQFLESTSLLIVNGITTIKREAPHPVPHTSVPHY